MNDMASEIASMQDELSYLRHELETAKRNLAVVTADRDRLQIENSLIQSRARASQDKATRVETILSQVSMGLVSGLSAIREDRDTERVQRRETQEQTFQQETEKDPPPAFLRRQEAQNVQTDAQRLPPPPAPRSAPTTAQLRAPLDRPSLRPGQVDTTLASRDNRLPGAPEWGGPREPEEGSLEDMAQTAVNMRGGFAQMRER